MIDPDGGEWMTIDQVRERLPHLKATLIRKWVSRGDVAAVTVQRRIWVRWPDVLDQEAAARRNGWRKGRRAATRRANRQMTGQWRIGMSH